MDILQFIEALLYIMIVYIGCLFMIAIGIIAGGYYFRLCNWVDENIVNKKK